MDKTSNLDELQEQLGMLIDGHVTTYNYFVNLLGNKELSEEEKSKCREAAKLAANGGTMLILLSLHNLFSAFMSVYLEEKGYTNKEGSVETLASSDELGL